MAESKEWRRLVSTPKGVPGSGRQELLYSLHSDSRLPASSCTPALLHSCTPVLLVLLYSSLVPDIRFGLLQSRAGGEPAVRSQLKRSAQ
jgi:hypothetical protein